MTWILVLVLMFAVGSVEAATRYASPSGSGSACSSGSPCSLTTMLSQAQCGDTLNLNDGTYTGSGSAVVNVDSSATPSATSCAGNRVTLQAINEGSVILDGQHSRYAILFFEIAGWNVIGVNARYSSTGANVIRCRSSQSITLQRVVAWDAGVNLSGSDANNQVILLWSCSTVLLEDVGAFGTGKQMVLDFDDSGTQAEHDIIYRRVWTRNEGAGYSTTGSAMQINYHSNTANTAGGPLIENTIFSLYGPRGTLATIDCTPFNTLCGFDYITETARDDSASPYTRQFGNISYIRALNSTDNMNSGFNRLVDDGTGACNGWQIRDSIYTANGQISRAIFSMFTNVGGCSSPQQSGPRELTRVIAISATAGNTDSATKTNYVEATSVAGSGFDYVGTSNTPKICLRYTDGTYTSTALWPWPMDERIKAAIALNTAGNGAVGGSSPSLAGSAGSGYTANTVTSEIVSIFGSIPASCLASGAFTPSFPVASDFPSVTVRDDFNRADSGTLGSGWTEVNADTFSIVSNTAHGPSSGFARAMYSDTKMQTDHEVYATYNTLPATGGYTTRVSFAATDLTGNNQYRVAVNRTSSANTLVEVIRIDGVGGETVVLSPVDLGIEAVDGNSFGVRVTGTTVSVYWKWTDNIWYRIGQFTDSNLSSLPSTGVYGGIAGAATAVVDNYGAGPFVDQPVQTPPSPPASVGAGRFGTTFPGVR